MKPPGDGRPIYITVRPLHEEAGVRCHGRFCVYYEGRKLCISDDPLRDTARGFLKVRRAAERRAHRSLRVRALGYGDDDTRRRGARGDIRGGNILTSATGPHCGGETPSSSP